MCSRAGTVIDVLDGFVMNYGALYIKSLRNAVDTSCAFCDQRSPPSGISPRAEG